MAHHKQEVDVAATLDEAVAVVIDRLSSMDGASVHWALAELEAAISPELAEQVEKILTKHENRRPSVVGGFLAPMTPRTPRSDRTPSSLSGVPLPLPVSELASE